MNLEKINLSELKPLKDNVRRHSEKQVDELVRSVTQFGQTRAIVIDEENNILIGNGLYYALQKMGKTECECFRKTGLSETEKKKLILTDNKVYSLGSDDYDGIHKYIQEITMTGDFDIAGFDTYTLEMMTIGEEENEEVMQDYGKITDEKLINSEPSQAPQNPPQSVPQQSMDKTIPTPQNVPEETPAPSAPPVSHTQKSVICPNCGEVIYLD